MNTLREAAQQALEALELVVVDVKTTPTAYEAQRQAIAALRAALKEPVKQCMAHGECFGGECIYQCPSGPVQDQQLRDDAARWKNIRGYVEEMEREIQALRAALAEPVQEPVAWRYQDARGNYRYRGYVQGFDKEYSRLKPVPLYAAPPQRKEDNDE